MGKPVRRSVDTERSEQPEAPSLELGQTLVEYVFVLILVALLCIAGLSIIGSETAESVNSMQNAIP